MGIYSCDILSPMEKKDGMKNRIWQFDLLRVIACLLVLLVHVSAQWLKKGVVPGTSSVIFAQSCNILAFSGVSLFVMISGALALRREISVKEALFKRFFRYMLLYELWRILYFIFYVIRSGQAGDLSAWKKYVFEGFTTLGGHYHLWYLPMLAMLFLLVPLIGDGAQKLPNCLLYIGVTFFAAFLFPTVFMFDFRGKPRLTVLLQPFPFEYFTGYLGYFLLGHLLYRWRDCLPGLKKTVLCVSGCLAFGLACIISAPRMAEDGDVWYGLATPLSPFTLLTSAAIFLFVITLKKDKSAAIEKSVSAEERELTGRNEHHSFLKFMADASFGIYLLHPAVLDLITDVFTIDMVMKPWIGIPCLLVGLYLITLLVVVIALRIPVLRHILR